MALPGPARAHEFRDRLQREPVGHQAEPGDRALRHPGHHGRVPERLPRRRVGDVHFDQEGGEHREGVPQRIGVVGEGVRVEHYRHVTVDRLVHPADEFRLVVGLPDVHVEPKRPAGGAADLRQLAEVRRTVHLGLAGAKAAKVRAVQHEHLPHRWITSWYARASRSSAGSVRMAGWPGPSRMTKRNDAPRDFLSPPIASRRAGQAPGRYVVGSPAAVRTWRCRATVIPSSRPASRASSAAYTMPLATAYPCRIPKSSTRSMA